MKKRFALFAVAFTLAVAVAWCWSVAAALNSNDEWWDPETAGPPGIIIWQK